jgi:AcrR family transcriptional regulator
VPKVSQQHREARRAQILDAARRCFLRNGFHATSMQDLFAESGLSSGAVYLYFGSKEEVILAIAEENMRDVVATIHGLTANSAGKGFGAALGEVLDVIGAKHADEQLGGIAVLVWSEALRNPAVAERFGQSLRQMEADLVRLINEHQADASAPGITTPETLAALIMSIIPGYILQLSLFGPSFAAAVRDAVQSLWPR